MDLYKLSGSKKHFGKSKKLFTEEDLKKEMKGTPFKVVRVKKNYKHKWEK